MTNLEAKESQDLTEKVLNIRYALDKLQTQKQWLEEDVRKLEQSHKTLKTQNEEFQKANKDFEEKLKTLNEQIREKQKELATQEAVFKDEITSQFEKIEEEKKILIKRERDVEGKENKVMRDEADNAQKQRSFESTALALETKEKSLANKEIELKIKNDNFNTFELTLNQKQTNINDKESLLSKRETSLKLKETELNVKAESVTREIDQANTMKLALTIDRDNYEKEKTKNWYILRVLQEIQTRCISNVWEEITKNVIEDIKTKYLDFINQPEPTIEPTIENIIDTPELPEENQTLADIDSTETLDQLPDETSDQWEAETMVDLTALSQEELVEYAKSKGINAQANWKAETIIKKLQTL